ncbi:hypothetical protein [Microbacterium sp. SLBN-146]|uniref:hypothetical protein n=1 Tax=Microbacterium sp. SLBN-146 TaxID=2768457 RepID=UPI001151C3FF|nr:hypothetical protein [Microbacterium sp. SLBN-146]TQJ30433.1 hypothetical protein FBY39_0885 [Microbacterium sp. SLBN-146]
MEPLLAFVMDFWWIAPASLGAGGVGYAVITKNPRRARRLELDAARHEAQLAYRDSLTAKANVRAALAQVQTAQAHRGRAVAGVPSVPDAKRALQQAKQAQRDAVLLLRAARTRVKAVQAGLVARTRDAELPIEKLMHAHDEVTARWLAYETDAALVLAYPQMSDAQHPDTLAFLRAQSEAHRWRPASVKAAVRPEEFVAYRKSIEVLAETFATAEASARRAAAAAARASARLRPVAAPPAARPVTPPGTPRASARDERTAPVWPVPSRTSRPGTAPGA